MDERDTAGTPSSPLGAAAIPRADEAAKALDTLLEFHNRAMNGGVLDAVEHFSGKGLPAIQSAYRLFGFEAVSMLIDSAQEALSREDTDFDSLEEELDQAYSKLIPDDETIFRASEPLTG
jgi:hypothetical protein